MSTEIEKKIQKLLLSEDFHALASKSNKFNIFNALKLENAEIRHSNFLGWLLSPNESHALGDVFLKELLRIILEKYYDVVPFKPSDIIFYDFQDAYIKREKSTDEGRRMDILIESKSNKFVCVIENKTWTDESVNQLTDYKKYIEKEYKDKDYNKKLFIFLKPKHDDIQLHKGYICLDYATVHQAIDNILNRQNVIINDEVRNFIKNYQEMVERDIMGKKDIEMTDLCSKIYQKHQKAIDTINFYAKAARSEMISDMLQKIIKDEKDPETDQYKLTLHKCDKRWVRFSTKTADGYQSLQISDHTDPKVTSEQTLIIEINTENQTIPADIIIRGPKDNSKVTQRKNLLALVMEKTPSKNQNKAQDHGWKTINDEDIKNDKGGYFHIYSAPLIAAEEYYESMTTLENRLKENLKKIIKVYEDFAEECNNKCGNNSTTK